MRSLADALAGVMRNRAYARPLASRSLGEAWSQALGRVGAEDARGRSRVQHLRGTNLTIEVDSAALRYELEAFRSAELLAALQADETVPTIRRLVYRLRSLSA